MKLLHLIPSLNPLGGGPAEFVKTVCFAHAEISVDSEIICFDDPDSDWIKRECKNLKVFSFGLYKLPILNKLIFYTWMLKNLHRFDALIVHGLWSFIGPAVRLGSRKTKVPYFVFAHGMLDPWFKHAYPLKHAKKFIYWLLVERLTLRDAKAVIFTCEEERLLARETFPFYKVVEAVSRFGISDPPEMHKQLAQSFISDYPHLKNKRIILFLSRIHEKKGCDLLVKAFAEVVNNHRNLHLLIAGPDSSNQSMKLKQIAKKLGIQDHITWSGMLRGDKKWAAFYTAEVFCLPSHQENFGIVVVEALACQKPVLISKKVNIWREIDKSKAGIVDEDTLDGTKRLLNKWLDMKDHQYLAMKSNAAACYRQYFHVEQAAKSLVEIIKGSLL